MPRAEKLSPEEKRRNRRVSARSKKLEVKIRHELADQTTVLRTKFAGVCDGCNYEYKSGHLMVRLSRGDLFFCYSNNRHCCWDTYIEKKARKRSEEIEAKTKVVEVREADKNHQVVTVLSKQDSYRKTPCVECPWRVENDKTFPAEAFRCSAETSYDMSERIFGCHMSSTENPTTCAGFILGAHHNLSLRLAYTDKRIDPNTVTNGGTELHPNYRAMAEANGVDPDDPCLKESR